VESLFGEYCSEQLFEHDKEMAALLAQEKDIRPREANTPVVHSQRTEGHDTGSEISPNISRCKENTHASALAPRAETITYIPSSEDAHPMAAPRLGSPSTPSRDQHGTDRNDDPDPTVPSRKRPHPESHIVERCIQAIDVSDSQITNASVSSSCASHYALRQDAYDAMLSNVHGEGTWLPISLISTDGHHHTAEEEL
jgi:hypothetical protein